MKKALIITTHHQPLHYEEYVKPWENILKKENIVFKIQAIQQNPSENITKNIQIIVITGTSLLDTHYLKYIDKWRNILVKFQGKILGICAGMQVLAKAHNIPLKKCLKIGTHYIKCNTDQLKIYDIHQYTIGKHHSLEQICYAGRCIEFFKIKNKEHYGFAFHPEVHNINLITTVLNQ